MGINLLSAPAGNPQRGAKSVALSPASLNQFGASLERLAAEFEELARHDARLPLERRNGCSAILAVRSWEFSEFTRLRRGSGARESRLG